MKEEMMASCRLILVCVCVCVAQTRSTLLPNFPTKPLALLQIDRFTLWIYFLLAEFFFFL